MTKSMRIARVALIALLAVLMFSCKEINRQSAPVELVLTTDQTLQKIDLAGGTGCDQAIGTVNIQSVLLQSPSNTNLPVDTRFDDVQLDRYEVTYVRTDGGTLIPQPFVRSISQLVTAGGTGSTPFIAFPTGAFSQAPFAALAPVNGGRDPETGKNFVQMEIVLTVFGQTLAGERVSGSTRVPLDFCYNCGGCS